jgi:hypothetical protein
MSSRPTSRSALGAAAERSRRLERAGWQIAGSGLLGADAKPPAPELEAIGRDLVSELASSWSSKYSHHIRSQGAHGGGYNYECVFSCPTEEKPVPGTVVRARFALMQPQHIPEKQPKEKAAMRGPDQLRALALDRALGGARLSRSGSRPGSSGGSKPSSTAGVSGSLDPQLVFSFEEGDMRHSWRLNRSASDGKITSTKGQQGASLRDGYFETYLDNYIAEKETVRARGIDLVTPFEATRLKPPPVDTHERSPSDLAESVREASMSLTGTANLGGVTMAAGRGMSDADLEMAEALKHALKAAGLACDLVAPPASLAELLVNVFDATDEEDAGELPHCEVARLLGATLSGLGLQEWDIQSLLMVAQENEDGLIECKPFIQTAPEIISELRRRRLKFIANGLPGVEIPPEAVKHCFSSELGETADNLTQLFAHCAQEDPDSSQWRAPEITSPDNRRRGSVVGSAPLEGSSNFGGGAGGGAVELVGLKRKACLDCFLSLPMRVSPQEAHRLMQMLPEDEDGFVNTEFMVERLEELRTGVLLNALVESDVETLRKHLVFCFRHVGVNERGKIAIWRIKQALLEADQICLSRQQIHLLLCLTMSSCGPSGEVDVASFLGKLCVVIPHMFNIDIFLESSEHLQQQAADAQRARENAELAALGASKTNKEEDAAEKVQEVEVDQETVEKILIQVFTLGDDLKRNPPAVAPETIYGLIRSSTDAQVISCQLSDYEICGFLAEMNLDSRGEVAYIDHVKRAVPMIYELRNNQLLNAYLQEDAFATLGISEPNLEKLEAIFPLLPDNHAEKNEEKNDARQSGRGRRRSISKTPNLDLNGEDGRASSGERRNSLETSGRNPSKRRPTITAAGLGMPGGLRARSSSFLAPGGGAGGKEPPKGRGYDRRKARLQAEQDTAREAQAAARIAAGSRSGSKESPGA